MWDKRYRQLKEGETIRKGDEVLASSKEGWVPARVLGGKAPNPLYTSHRLYRRKKIPLWLKVLMVASIVILYWFVFAGGALLYCLNYC